MNIKFEAFLFTIIIEIRITQNRKMKRNILAHKVVLV